MVYVQKMLVKQDTALTPASLSSTTLLQIFYVTFVSVVSKY